MRKFLLIGMLAFASCTEQNNTVKENSTSEKPETNVVKTDTSQTGNAPAATLTVSPLDASGDLGRVTFSQNEKTIFYYDSKTKKGEIRINDKMQILTQYNFDSKKETYELSNAEVKILTGPCKFKENDGSDCFYGTIKDISISSGGAELVLHEVAVQDCPNY